MKTFTAFRADEDVLISLKQFIEKEHCSLGYAINKHLRLGLSISEQPFKVAVEAIKQIPVKEDVYLEKPEQVIQTPKYIDKDAIRKIEYRISELEDEANQQGTIISMGPKTTAGIAAKELQIGIMEDISELRAQKRRLEKGL